MKTIILAAWGWTRLFPFTTYNAKPLINILDKPILKYILESVYDLSDEFFITIKHFKNDFENYIWNSYKGKKITYIEQWKEKWTAAALYNFDYNYFAWEKILIMNWDNIINKNDLKNLIGSIKHYWCLAKFSNSPSNHWVLKIWTDNKISSIIEKPSRFIWNLVNWWVYIVNNEIFKIVKEVKLSKRWEYEITDAINMFISENIFDYYEIKNKYFHLTTPFDIYKTWIFFLKESKKSKYFSDYTHINLSWYNYIWKSCIIWNNATLNNCIIYDWVKIWDHSVLSNCLIWENTHIWENFNFSSDKIKIFWPNSFLVQK